MPLLALTGGIASGKSTIASVLADHGAVVVDADQIVRDVQSPGGEVLDRIADEFGARMIGPDGSLNRAVLGSHVFGDPERVARLNEIVHPAVRAESARRFRAAFADDAEAIVVYDVPLLVESRSDGPWDLVVVAHAPAAERLRRLENDRGMSREDAAARIASQAGDAERLAIADVVIDTSGTLDETRAQAARVIEDLPRLLADRERAE